jgi:hypothetical protein
MQKITKRDWVKYFPFDAPRKDQEEFIDFALNAFMREGKRFVIGELPMGIGKSAVAVTIARYLAATDPPTELDDEGEPIVTRGAYVLTTQNLQLPNVISDIFFRRNSWMYLVFNGKILGWQAKSIKAHWMQNIEALHTFHPGKNISSNIAFWMAHM